MPTKPTPARPVEQKLLQSNFARLGRRLSKSSSAPGEEKDQIALSFESCVANIELLPGCESQCRR